MTKAFGNESASRVSFMLAPFGGKHAAGNPFTISKRRFNRYLLEDQGGLYLRGQVGQRPRSGVNRISEQAATGAPDDRTRRGREIVIRVDHWRRSLRRRSPAAHLT